MALSIGAKGMRRARAHWLGELKRVAPRVGPADHFARFATARLGT